MLFSSQAFDTRVGLKLQTVVMEISRLDYYLLPAQPCSENIKMSLLRGTALRYSNISLTHKLI